MDEGKRPGRTVEVEVVALAGDEQRSKCDRVVTEEPLELRLIAKGETRTLAITMRTPGNDFELAAGFVYNEAIVRAPDEIVHITYCLDRTIAEEQRYNVVNVELAAGAMPDIARFERHFTMTSACGVCGRAHLDALRDLGIAPIADDLRVPPTLLYALPERMRVAQRIFSSTGGLHAAALFSEGGDALAVREDIGRHNALDKLIGWAVLNARLPLERTILLVSGRASYEILQKSAMARIPIVASVSAPSSLAIDLARAFNITLAGFVRDNRCNVYSGAERIVPD